MTVRTLFLDMLANNSLLDGFKGARMINPIVS